LSESGAPGRRTSGLHAFAFAARAPRASMRSPLTRAHPSRFEIWIRDLESQNQLWFAFRNMSGPKRRKAARFPWGGPSARLGADVHVNRVRDLRRYPYPDRTGRSWSTADEATWASTTRPCWRVPFDYVGVVSARRVPWTIRRITVREGSVKPFLDEIHNHARRFVFRHRGEFSNATIVTGAQIASST
jgi:hypothetical protein